jgi:hypothetical protein
VKPVAAGLAACCAGTFNQQQQDYADMTQFVLALLFFRVLDFIKTVFFGAYPSGPLGMGY